MHFCRFQFACGSSQIFDVSDFVASRFVHVPQMTAQVPTLREGTAASRTAERLLARVLAEVIAQIAAFFEQRVTTLDTAAEEQLHTRCGSVLDLYSLLPTGWDSLKQVRLRNFRVVSTTLRQNIAILFCQLRSL